MDASFLAVAKSIYYLFKYAVYILVIFFIIIFLDFRADSFVRSLLAVFCHLFFLP